MKLLALIPLFVALLIPAVETKAQAGTQYSAFKRKGKGPFKTEWTSAAIKEIKANRSKFEKARDVEKYCPGYGSGTEDQKNNCWLRLMSGIMAFESEFTPNAIGDQGRSCGLMQIMSMNCKEDGFQCEQLRQPQNNIKCGTRMMGRLIARDGVISDEAQVQGRTKMRTRRRGLGRGGWTVMMRSMMIGKWQAGHLPEIEQGLRTFRDHSQGTPAGPSNRTGGISDLACEDPSFRFGPGERLAVAGY